MAGSLTDKLRKASGSTRPVVTDLALPKANGATTAELTAGTGWNTTTGVDIVMYRRQLNTTTGLYEKIDGTQTEWVGTLTGTTLTLPATPNAGTEPAAGYAADGNTVVFCGPTSQWSDDLIETLLTLFNQDQTLKPGPIQTALGLGAASLNGWNALGFTFNTVTALGNRSYQGVINGQDVTSTLSAGMRLRTTRTVAAPTQCTSLNGTTQYYSKASPAGMTFTVTATAMGARKINAYSAQWFGGRTTGTNGFRYGINASGQLIFEVQPGNATTKTVTSYQSVPLNKWFRFAFQIDLAGTCAIMLDGADIPSTTAGTATSLTQASADFQLGAAGGTGFTNGKMAQDALFSTKLTSATVRSYEGQSYAGTETSLISAYSFNNTINDLNTTNANNLTANGSAVATSADSPYGNSGKSSTLDYAIISADPTFSTNTTVTFQVAEGCTVPTSGGVASVVYSSNGVPYGFPKQRGKWKVSTLVKAILTGTSTASGVWTSTGININLPIGSWQLGYQGDLQFHATTGRIISGFYNLGTSAPTTNIFYQDLTTRLFNGAAGADVLESVSVQRPYDLAAQTTYNFYNCTDDAVATISWSIRGDQGEFEIFAENSYL